MSRRGISGGSKTLYGEYSSNVPPLPSDLRPAAHGEGGDMTRFSGPSPAWPGPGRVGWNGSGRAGEGGGILLDLWGRAAAGLGEGDMTKGI